MAASASCFTLGDFRAICTVGQLAVDNTLGPRSDYVKKGDETSQVIRIREALKPLVAPYEELPASRTSGFPPDIARFKANILA